MAREYSSQRGLGRVVTGFRFSRMETNLTPRSKSLIGAVLEAEKIEKEVRASLLLSIVSDCDTLWL